MQNSMANCNSSRTKLYEISEFCTSSHSQTASQTYHNQRFTASRRPDLRSANIADYVKRCTRTKFGELCFSHAGPAAWNSLPASIKLTTDTNRFKKTS